MALIDTLFSALAKVPLGANGGTVAQSRFTHNPIVYEPTRDASWAGNTDPAQPWWKLALGQGLPLAGIPATQQGTIEIQPGVPGGNRPDTLRHETVHAAVTGDLADPTIYRQVLRGLPAEVKSEVPRMWGNLDQGSSPTDTIVHEGLARFLTDPSYFDPKWNKQKLNLVNLFPTATRGKLTRILANQGLETPGR